MIVCEIGQRGAFQGLLSAARAARRADYKFGMTSFQNVSKQKRKRQQKRRRMKTATTSSLSMPVTHFRAHHFSFWCDFRAGVASRRVLRKLCQRKRRATFALAMLIVGVNKQFRRVRQSEMHKRWRGRMRENLRAAAHLNLPWRSYVFENDFKLFLFIFL